ncbi:Thivi_2564 family membrane protein [Thiorhodovibrio winogradskyi]
MPAYRGNTHVPVGQLTRVSALYASEQSIPVPGDILSLSRKPSQRRKTMPLITLIVTLAVVGLILWAINTYLPMDGKIKQILNIVVLIVVILWLLSVFGILPSMSTMRIG